MSDRILLHAPEKLFELTLMNMTSLDADESSLDDACRNQYAAWGGLAAEIGSLEGFALVRMTQPKIASLLAKLDSLQSAPRTVNGLQSAMAACTFTSEDVNYLNSPLLDGIRSVLAKWQDDPAGTRRHPSDVKESYHAFVMRTIRPVTKPETLCFLLDGCTTWDVHSKDGEALREAAITGDATMVRALLRKGARLTPPQPKASFTVRFQGTCSGCALCDAAKRDHVDVVRALVEACPDASECVRRAVCKAAKHGQAEVLRVLFDKLHPVDAVLSNEALYLAVYGNHVTTVRVLLAKGADLHLRDDRVLQLAASVANVEIIRLLLSHGADVTANDSAALCNAVERKTDAGSVFTELMATGASIHARCDHVLRLAIRSEDLDLLDLIFKHGASISAPMLASRDSSDLPEPPLVYAVRLRKPAVCEWLLDHGADVNVNDGAALRAACAQCEIGGHGIDAVYFLLQRGARVDVQDQACLYSALARCDFALITVLLDCGADIHMSRTLREEDHGGLYLLGIIPLPGLRDDPDDGDDWAEAIAQAGASEANPFDARQPSVVDDYPLYSAIMEHHSVELVKLLLARGASLRALPAHTLVELMHRRDLEMLALLLQYPGMASADQLRPMLFAPYPSLCSPELTMVIDLAVTEVTERQLPVAQ